MFNLYSGCHCVPLVTFELLNNSITFERLKEKLKTVSLSKTCEN